MVKYGNYSHNKKRPIFYIITSAICVSLIGVVAWALIGYFSKTVPINWSMQGSLVTEDGLLKDTTKLTITGKIQKDSEKRDVLKLDISLPETFPYSFSANDTFYSTSDTIVTMPYYVCSGYTLKKGSDAPELCFFALDAEKQWMVFLWPEECEQLLVASVDPEADPKQIISHFKAFLDSQKANK